MAEAISPKDRMILRDLAKRQYEYSQLPEMQQIKKDWRLHNDCKGTRPMVNLDISTYELVPEMQKCEGKAAREIEFSLYMNFLNYALFNDDSVVKDYFPITYGCWFKAFDIDIKVEHSKTGGLGHHFVEIIKDLRNDFHLLTKSVWGSNKAQALERYNYINDIFGDILPPKIVGMCLYAVPTQDIVHFMSMENMYLSIYDYPDEFHEMMNRLTNDYIEYFSYMQDNRLILPTADDEHLSQGSYCFTGELPGRDEFIKRPFTPADVWGFMDSQESVGLSPKVFEEFIFPYYKRIAEKFALLSYGCCEPVHPIWDNCLSKLANLRKVSISPWCNEEYMGERLRGKKIIYHRKPSANHIGVGTVLDEDELVKAIRKTVSAARGCHLEITQRDIYTINRDPAKVKKFVEIINRECGKHTV